MLTEDDRNAAQIALSASLLRLERDLPVQQDGPPTAIAPNGKPYVLLEPEQPYLGAMHADHWSRHRFQRYPTSGEAIAGWLRKLLDYAASNPGDTLWWRNRPEIVGHQHHSAKCASWFVYSRLMIGYAADVRAAAA
jgi:hypothetical protein